MDTERKFKSGDKVQFEGKTYYYQSNGGNFGYLYESEVDIGHPEDAFGRIPNSELEYALKRGDKVAYEGEIYYYQPTGNKAYLYTHSADVGYPIKSVHLVSKSELEPVRKPKFVPSFYDGQVVLYNSRFHYFGAMIDRSHARIHRRKSDEALVVPVNELQSGPNLDDLDPYTLYEEILQIKKVLNI
jgi:hypothetical protein